MRAPFGKIDRAVFFVSAGLILSIVCFGAVATEEAGRIFGLLQAAIVARFGWLYVLAVAVFLVLVAALAFSSLGNVRLGPDSAEPDFSYPSWIAMLFSAGMGIGLMFFGVAEPVSHYAAPPTMDGGSVSAAREAMKITFFHWGVHAWAIYALVGLSLAYFGFRRGLPLTIRSGLYPILGPHMDGPAGKLIDILAVLGTMFGVATSLGIGAMQVNAGLSHLFGIPDTFGTQVLLIALITTMATASVVSGLSVGIRRISEFNLLLAIALMLFVFIAGPTLFLLKAFVQNVGAYLSDLVARTFTLFAYEPNEWLGEWTLFYWAWWIAWSPFVGMFIARISRGRTIREFVVGVLLVPVGFTFLWMTVFGNTAILLDMTGEGSLAAVVTSHMPLALFTFLESLPMSGLISLLATVLLVTFFVTSSDSGSLVIDIITAGGEPDPPKWQRVFWAVTEGVVAAVLLGAGGLAALQTASLTSALPFTLVLFAICWCLYAGLREERVRRESHRIVPVLPAATPPVSWRRRLETVLHSPGREDAERYLFEIVRPAFAEVAAAMREHAPDAAVSGGPHHATLAVVDPGAGDHPFDYTVRLRAYTPPRFALRDLPPGAAAGGRVWRAEVHLSESGAPYDVLGWTKEQLIADIVAHYERHRQYLHMIAEGS